MSSRRWRGGRRRRRRKWWRAHTIENLSRRGTATRQIQRSKWRFYANRGFHFSSHRPSAILCFHSFSPLPSFFFSSLLTAHFCHACGANRRPPSHRFLSIEKELGEREGEGRAIYPPYLAYGVDEAQLLILLQIFLFLSL